MKNQQPQNPSLLKGHPYRHSDLGVDVRETWRRFGWEPKSPLADAPLPPQTSSRTGSKQN